VTKVYPQKKKKKKNNKGGGEGKRVDIVKSKGARENSQLGGREGEGERVEGGWRD